MQSRKQKNTDLPEFTWIKNITQLMDSAVRIPGTNIRFGLDGILGLLPGAGDFASFGVSAILVMAMIRHGISGKVALMMVGNVLIDYLVGSVPLLGDIFDFAFKANERNYQLLQQHYEEGRYQGAPWGMLIAVALLFLAMLAGGIYFAWKLGASVLGVFVG